MHDAFPKRRLWGASLANSSGSETYWNTEQITSAVFLSFHTRMKPSCILHKKKQCLSLFTCFCFSQVCKQKVTPIKTADWLNVNRNCSGPGDNRYDLHHKAFGKNRTFLIMRVYRKCHSAVWAEPSGCTAPSLQVAAASSAARVFAVFKM